MSNVQRSQGFKRPLIGFFSVMLLAGSLLGAVAQAAVAEPPVVGVWQGPDTVNGQDHGVVTMALTVESGNRLIMYRHDTQWGFCDKTEGVSFSRVRWNPATQSIEGAGASHTYCLDGRTRKLNIVGTVFYVYDAQKDMIDSPAAAIDNPMSRLCAGSGFTHAGTPGDDVIVGTPGSDIIEGRGGNDTLDGQGGFDVLCGGSGADTLVGGEGPDLLWGESGRDLLQGDAGHDGIFGSAGADDASGGDGRDLMAGEGGRDTLLGNKGSDWLFGGTRDDAPLNGGSGSDLIFGGAGSDSITGRAGNDRMYGQGGDDTLNGGSGGKDRAHGGSGTDSCDAERVKKCE